MSGFSLNLVLRHNRVSIRWHMTKLQIKSDRITSFGGIYFVNRLFDQFSLGKVINDTLACAVLKVQRLPVGWDRQVIVRHLPLWQWPYRGHYFPSCLVLVKPPDSHVPSSDTIGRGIKQLATDNITYTAKSGNTYAFNTNELLNDLLMKLQHGRGGFSRVVSSWMWTLTINSFPRRNTMPHTPTRKRSGYFPGVASVGGVIVHVENRDGNTPVKFCQGKKRLLKYSPLRKHGRSFTDPVPTCGSYSKEIVKP